MTNAKAERPAYRSVVLPGLGKVEVPVTVTDAQVLAEVLGEEAPDTSPKKSKKKP